MQHWHFYEMTSLDPQHESEPDPRWHRRLQISVGAHPQAASNQTHPGPGNEGTSGDAHYVARQYK